MNRNRLYKLALGLAIFTIVFNIIEGLASTWFGYHDESLALFGFGADSFIEVISGLGIAHMIIRIRSTDNGSENKFENTALRITGFAFYALVIGLVFSGAYNVITGHKPETTFWGVIISLVSLSVMWALYILKVNTGRKLDSEAVLEDAECTRVCIYMSVVLLISSGIYELTGFAYIDVIGTIGLAYLSFKEGRECFEKALKVKISSFSDVS